MEIFFVWGIKVRRRWQPFVLTSWACAGDQLASEELGAHSEGQTGRTAQVGDLTAREK